MAQLKNTTIAGTLDITGNTSTTNGNITSTTGVLSMGADTDTVNILGRAKIGYDGTNSDTVMFAHYDNATPENAGYRQLSTGQSVFNAKTGTSLSLRINNSAVMTVTSSSIGILTTSTTYTLNLGSGANRTFGIPRSTSSAIGRTLGIYAGGGATGTDITGGDLILASGISTGNALGGAIKLQVPNRASASGTGDNVLYDRVIVPSEVNLTDNTATSLFEIALPAGTYAGGTMEYTVTVSDGTDFQVHSGWVTYAVANKGGAYTTDIVDEVPTGEAEAYTAGTLSEAWSILNGTNKVTIQATFNTSLTPTSMKLYYTLHNFSTQAITIL